MCKKKLYLIISAILACSLTGCQLASENAGTDGNEEHMIGVFVTTEYLDLFDMDRYLDRHIGALSGGEITVEPTDNYQEKLYAVLKTVEETDENGRQTESSEYVFEGVEGISFFAPTYPETEDEDSYIGTSSDDAVSDTHLDVSVGDAEDKTTLTGTIYLSPESGSERTYYVNPVFQCSDGSVYVTSGNGYQTNPDESDAEGELWNVTLDFTSTTTENGISKKDTFSVSVSFSSIYRPEKLVLLQMAPDSSILSRTEYAPGEMPDLLTPDSETEYLIVETHKTDTDGAPVVTRETVSRGQEAFDTFYCRKDNICAVRTTRLQWDDGHLQPK